MRISFVFVPALGAALLTAPAARAYEPVAADCLPAVVAWPVYTITGRWLGAVAAPARPMPRLEVSRFTGQPLTVIYNDPARVPGAADPYVELVPLPRVPHRKTQAVYPRGY